MLVLALSLLALVVGPLLVALASGRGRATLSFVDGFSLTALVGVVVLEVFPELLADTGVLAVPAAVVGFLLPVLLHRVNARADPKANGKLRVPLFGAAALGVLAHAVVDGAALASGGALSLAVILHRLPIGVAVWWIARPLVGTPRAIALLAAEGGGTLLGYAFGAGALAVLSSPLIGLGQALVAGSILHVVTSHAPPIGDGENPRRASGLGALLGAIVLAAILEPEARTSAVAWTSRMAPAVLLGGVVTFAFRALRGARIEAGGAQLVVDAFQGLRAALVDGMPPLRRNLVPRAKKSEQLAYATAAPLTAITAVLVVTACLRLVSVPVVVAGAVCALLVGIVGAMVAKAAPMQPIREESSFRKRGALRPAIAPEKKALDHARDVVDGLVPALFAGAALAVVVDEAEQPVTSMALALCVVLVPLQVSALLAAPIAAALVAHGLAPAWAAVLLIVAPGWGVTIHQALAARHGHATAFVHLLGIALAALSAFVLVDATALDAGPVTTRAGEICALIVAALCAEAFVRKGARGILGALVAPSAHRLDDGHARVHGHDPMHMHGPNCGHAAVPHGDHVDYVVGGHLHHPHGDHCDDHGARG